MNKKFVAILTAFSLMAGAAYAEEARHGMRGSASNTGVSSGVLNESNRERPDAFARPDHPANTIPVLAGSIMSSKELGRAGLKPDDIVVHVSVF